MIEERLKTRAKCSKISGPTGAGNAALALTTHAIKEHGMADQQPISSRAAQQSKYCHRCGCLFRRPIDMSLRQWGARHYCDACCLEELKDRLLSRISIEGECWIWQGSSHLSHGYGQITINDYPNRTHVVSYKLFVGEIPSGMFVCHMCDVRLCCNPSHLFLGTPKDNVHDMIRKGRGSKPPVHYGLDNSNATLTDEQVAALRSFVERGATQREAAEKFCCAQSTVWRIVNRKTRNV